MSVTQNLLILFTLISLHFNANIPIENTIPTTANKPSAIQNMARLTEQKFNKILSNNSADIDNLKLSTFKQAYWGFLNLIDQKALPADAHLLTICDFNLSANKKRLWVIDLKSEKILYHSLVSHGKNTGEEYASQFSNKINSYQSSLGFYKTGQTYEGGNGYSLKLIGLDEGYNSNALERAIVMHGADYCSQDFIQANERLGRSFGCPAIPRAIAIPLINQIKEEQCLYIHYNDNRYLQNSKWLQQPPSLAIMQQFDQEC